MCVCIYIYIYIYLQICVYYATRYREGPQRGSDRLRPHRILPQCFASETVPRGFRPTLVWFSSESYSKHLVLISP